MRERTEIPGVYKRGGRFEATWRLGGRQFSAAAATLEQAAEIRERGRTYARSLSGRDAKRDARMSEAAEMAATDSLLRLAGSIGIDVGEPERLRLARRTIALATVAHATAKCRDALVEWQAALRAARQAGHTLSEIAAEAGVSHIHVHRVTSKPGRFYGPRGLA